MRKEEDVAFVLSAVLASHWAHQVDYHDLAVQSLKIPAPTDVALLQVPEIGPVADTIFLFQAVKVMRPIPIGKPSLLAIGLPAVIPIVVVFAIKVPLREMRTKLLHAVA